MLEYRLATLGAPTLAGLKTGNLFNTAGINEEKLVKDACRLSPLLAEGGLRLAIFPRKCNRRTLCYIYREEALAKDLAQPKVKKVLQSLGYKSATLDDALCSLSARLQEEEFPHEIGFFLSYAPSDVLAFMKHGSAKCLYSGYWCVFSEVEQKRMIFARFDRCKRCYERRYTRERNLRALIQRHNRKG